MRKPFPKGCGFLKPIPGICLFVLVIFLLQCIVYGIGKDAIGDALNGRLWLISKDGVGNFLRVGAVVIKPGRVLTDQPAYFPNNRIFRFPVLQMFVFFRLGFLKTIKGGKNFFFSHIQKFRTSFDLIHVYSFVQRASSLIREAHARPV